jgi:ribosomal protein L29
MAKEVFKNKSESELREALKEKRNLLREFRFKVSKGRAKNNKEGRGLHRDIARILTELNRQK